MKCLKFLPALLLLITLNSRAAIIHMKNGDAYHAEILREEYGNYVQILLNDGSEKHLSASDIESIDHTPSKTSAPPQQTPIKETQVLNSQPIDEYPSQMLNDHEKIRFDLDLIGASYDSTWQKASFQVNGSNTSIDASVTNHYVRMAPMEFTFRAYLNRWHLYLDYLDAATNGNDIKDQSFSTVALAYALSRGFDLGLAFDFGYATTSAQAGNTTSLTGSDYAFGPFFRLVAPVSNYAAIEISGSAGLDFRNLVVTESSASLNGNDAAFFATLRVGVSVSIVKQVSYLFWVDGWFDLGTLSGTIDSQGPSVNGTLLDNVYRLRVVPLGLRLKF